MNFFSKILSVNVFSLLIFLASCTSSHDARYKSTKSIADSNGFVEKLVVTKDFSLLTFQKISNKNLPIVFYIEGDGLAFKNKSTISDDPTPVNPMLFNLATLDKRPNIVYIARPCQFVPLKNNNLCSDHLYWTNKRFAKEIVDSMRQAIDQIRGISPIHLIGFSGGGGIAVLIAAQETYGKSQDSPNADQVKGITLSASTKDISPVRSQIKAITPGASPASPVKDIITIAANLDHVSFNLHHQVPMMTGSLNPIYYAQQVNQIPQLHLIGGEDKVVPKLLAENFIKASDSNCVQMKILPGITHNIGWDKVWPSIVNTPLPTCIK